MLDAAEIKRRVPIETVLAHYGGTLTAKGEGRCLFPHNHKNGDADPSMTVRDGRVKCWSQGCFGEKGVDAFGLVGLKEGLLNFPDQRRRVMEIGGIADQGNGNGQGRIVATYDYIDETGALLFQVVRFEPKDFRQRQPDGKGGWLWNLKDTRLVLYRLPDVVKAGTVLIVEGEKDVETAERFGLPEGWAATCNPMGAQKWKPEYSEFLRDKGVVILPDDDDAGRQHLQVVGQALQGIASEVLTVTLPQDKDLSAWADAGGSAEAFRALLEAAGTFSPACPEVPLENEIATAIATARLAEHYGLKLGRQVELLADLLLTCQHFAVDTGGQLYVYENGCYRPHGKQTIARLTKTLLRATQKAAWWSSHLVKELTIFITTDAPPLWDMPPSDTLNVKNGLLDLSTKTLRPHAPTFLSSIQLPVSFDQKATCPAWERFLQAVFPEDAVMLAYEVVAFLLRPDLSIQKAILLIGEGSNGKSTFLAAITALIGPDHVTNLSLHTLEDDKFASSRLVGKLANICPDLPGSVVDGSSKFKALLGGDRMTAERKFCTSFEFTPIARHLFSANSFPRSKDASHAFFRRWVVIPFDRTFSSADQRSRSVLDAELAAPAELSGMLNKALEVLPDLARRGNFRECESTRAAWLEFREQTDPFASWLDSQTRLRSAGFVSKTDLEIVYSAYAEESQFPKMTKNLLGRALKRLRPGLTEGQRTIAGEIKHCWLGLELMPSSSQDSQDPSIYKPVSAEGDREYLGLNRENPVNPVSSPLSGSREVIDLVN